MSIFGRTKEFSEVRGTSQMCNFGVRSRFLDVIYGVRPPNGGPAVCVCVCVRVLVVLVGGGQDVITIQTFIMTPLSATVSRVSTARGVGGGGGGGGGGGAVGTNAFYSLNAC